MIMLEMNYWICIFPLWIVNLLSVQAKNPEICVNEDVKSYNTEYEKCATSVTCDAVSKYRTINGSCNNLENQWWGTSKTPFMRLIPAYYGDGNYSIRLQSDGSMLPGPRELQLELFLKKSRDLNDTRNYHVNQIGQWLTHDITLMFPVSTGPPDCCAIQDTKSIPTKCQAVINVPDNDPVYSHIQKTCLPFVRAETSTFHYNCDITPQIQVNKETAFVDLSQLYGPDETTASSLRSFVDGQLKFQIIDGQHFTVEEQRNGSKTCDGRDNVAICLDGGDPRHNQHFGMTLYQEMYARFHNYVAGLLQEINPHWCDEKLYQEARRILGAINQIIMYRDYIPVLLGKTYSEEHELTLSKDKKTIYDPLIMPQLSIEFAVGAFRVPHNVIPSEYIFMDKNENIVNKTRLNDFMSFPGPITYNDNFEKILRGMTNMPGRCPMASYNFLISNFMFHNFPPGSADMDLLSVDIQRGRETGMPPYTKAREICGFPTVSSFDDLSDVLLDEDINILKTLYATVDDIDLIVGALLEQLVPDGMVGPTARCLIADELHRLRYGDRFFCDVENQPGSFTSEQFDILWELDLAKIFCATTRMDKLPKDIFMPYGSDFSENYDCKKSLDLDLKAWREVNIN